jgi:hypothetical protein
LVALVVAGMTVLAATAGRPVGVAVAEELKQSVVHDEIGPIR